MPQKTMNYRYRIYPSKKQIRRLSKNLDVCRRMYNELLEINIETYKNTGKGLTGYDLNNCIKYLDTNTDVVYAQVKQNINDRISKAFKSFFRRCKERKSGKRVKVGFPRFKKSYKSITYPQKGFRFKSDKRLYISKIGNIPIIKHREIKGKIKTMTIKRTPSNQWFVVFSCEAEPKERKHSNKKIGIDVGLESFATFSDGTKIENPRFLVESEKKLKKYQRRLSRKKKGSKNRMKARLKLARVHNHISNQRDGFLHKQSRWIADNYGFIAVEKLNIKNMVRNHYLAKSISDASWNSFIQKLCYKAESAGAEFVQVDSRGTTQECSKCGREVSKSLAVRTHKCSCGLVLDRDHNSAINILNRATVGLTESHACGDSASTSCLEYGACRVKEAGTIRDEIGAGSSRL